jgi:uncharacterized membrane protein YoaK (UPF0700 family)
VHLTWNDADCEGIKVMRAVVVDAWRTIVPGPQDKDGPLAPLLLALTLVTGLVDAFSYLSLGHVFVANMTGNVVFLGFALAGAPGFSLMASLTALAAFSLGALVGGRLSASLGRHRGRLLAKVSAVEVVLVTAAAIIVAAVQSPGDGAARYVIITVLSLSMGAQNAMARKLAVHDLTTTVLTMTITGISADSRLAGGGGSKTGRRLVSAVAMFLGALIGALLLLKVSREAAILAPLVMLCVVAVTAAQRSRSNGAWVEPST